MVLALVMRGVLRRGIAPPHPLRFEFERTASVLLMRFFPHHRHAGAADRAGSVCAGCVSSANKQQTKPALVFFPSVSVTVATPPISRSDT